MIAFPVNRFYLNLVFLNNNFLVITDITLNDSVPDGQISVN